MRTFDKLIATIFSHQGTGHLRLFFGVRPAATLAKRNMTNLCRRQQQDPKPIF